MPRNLPLAFGELLIGGVILEAAIKDASLSGVVRGNAQSGTGLGSTVAGATASTAAPAASAPVSVAGLGFGSSQPTSGPAAAQKALTDAEGAIGGPYSQANHATAFNEAISAVKATGTDCSGFVSWLLGPQGTKTLSSPESTVTLPSTPGILKGAGQYITLWNNPNPGNSGHVFIEILGRWFQSAGGGTGIQSISPANAKSMIASGDNGAKYDPLHPQGL